MKVLPFTIPIKHDRTIIAEREQLPHFYPHLHRHKEIQLTWIQKGEGTLVAQTDMHSFWPGEIYLLGANQPHVFKSDPAYFNTNNHKSVQALTIFFNHDTTLSHLLAFPEMKKIRHFLKESANGFKIPEKEASIISGKMLNVLRYTGVDQFIHFLDLLNTFTRMERPQPLVSGSGRCSITDQEGLRIAEIYNYIMQHYDQEIMLEDVANQAHMTPQAFCRYFKKHTRHTFVSFLNEVRINEACKKFTEGGFDSISTVAYTTGFNSITNFNRVFKSITGKSPRQYIREFEYRTGAYHSLQFD